MDYYGIKHPEAYWAKLTAVKKDKKSGTVIREYGCSENKMIDVATSLGFFGYVKQHSSIGELKKFIKNGVPIIVNWFSPEEGAHFSVVAGFEKDKIILADPHFGECKKYSITWFKERWFDSVPYPRTRVEDMILRGIVVWYKKTVTEPIHRTYYCDMNIAMYILTSPSFQRISISKYSFRNMHMILISQ